MRSPGESSRDQSGDRSRPRRWIGARSPASWAFAARQPHGRSRPQQRLDRAALVHRAVALRHLLERQVQVEDLAGVDLPVPDQLDKLGQEAPHRGGTAVQVHMREEELLPRDLHVVEHAHEPNVTACPRGADGLHHGLLRADRLDDRVRPETVGHVLDPCRALLAALGHDLGRAELQREPLAGLVAAHRDNPLRAKLLGGEHRKQADGTVADDRHCLARTGLGRHGAKPAGAEHVGSRKQAGDHVLRRQARRRYEGAVGQRDAGVLCLCAGGSTGLPVDARRMVTGPADLAGVVGGEERSDDELARLDQTYLAADLLDDADVLMAHRGRPVDRLDAAVGPEVRAAHAADRQSDAGVGRLDDRRVGTLLEAHVPGAIKNCSLHDLSPSEYRVLGRVFNVRSAAWRDLHARRVHRNGVTVGDEYHYTVWPPSTTIACPTTKEATSEHSYRTAAAISSGSPILPMGSCEFPGGCFLLLNPRVVEGDVKTSEGLDGPVQNASHILGPRHIAPDGKCPSAKSSIMCAVSWLPCSDKSATTTPAPSRANASAVARPMPLPAPVTNATFPA